MKAPTLLESVGARGVIAGVVALGIAIALVTCRPETAAVPDTVGAVPEETTPTTLLEFVPDTDPPDPTAEPTVPPGSLFGGDPCTALVALDFARTIIDSAAAGVLVDFSPLSDDACGYLVAAGEKEYNITVQAVDLTTFGRPADDDEDRVALIGIGQSAYGVAGEDDYAVWVQVDNGYFVVITPDQTSAMDLAKIAVRNADGIIE